MLEYSFTRSFAILCTGIDIYTYVFCHSKDYAADRDFELEPLYTYTIFIMCTMNYKVNLKTREYG